MGYNLYHYYGYIRSFCLHGHPSYELIIICGCISKLNMVVAIPGTHLCGGSLL